MKFSLFHKPKQQEEPENPTAPTNQPNPEAATPQTTETSEGQVEATQNKSPTEGKENTEPTNPETSTSQPEPAAESAPAQENIAPEQEPKQEVATTQSKTYLKAMPLKELTDIENVKAEVRNGNIIILRVTPLANKSIEDVKTAVNQLYEFTESVGGDIARLGEERVVICPKNIRIWREKTPASSEPVSAEALPTVA